MQKKDDSKKLKGQTHHELLDVVIENYLDKGDPIGSKFLHTVEGVDYAPSTLRKYLNSLEKEGLVFQPYNSSGRVPTIQGISQYLDKIMEEKTDLLDEIKFDLDYSRNGLRFIVENLGTHVDGVVVGFLKHDEYFFLGINNIIKQFGEEDMEATKQIVSFIENKEIMKVLDKKIIKDGKIYYTFVGEDQKAISCLYTKLNINGYQAILCVIGPLRVNYKKNLAIIKKLVAMHVK